MAIESIFKHESQLAYSLKKQAAVGTPLSSADLSKSIRLKKTPLPELSTETLDDRDRYSRGNEWALEQKVERHGITFSFATDLDSHSAGFMFAFALGQVSSATSSTLSYTHTMKPKDLEDDKSLPVTTFALSLHPDGPKKKLRAMACDSVELNLTTKDRAEITSSWKGSGELTATTMTMPTSLVSQDYLRGGDVQFMLGTGATLVDCSQALETFKIGFKNNIPDDKKYRFGGGLYASEFSVGKRDVDLTFRLRMDKDNWDEIDALRDQTKKSIELSITGSAIDSEYEKITINVPNILFKEVKLAESGEEIVVDITAKTLYDQSLDAPFSVEIVNTDASYLGT